jgi:hypothetical protein
MYICTNITPEPPRPMRPVKQVLQREHVASDPLPLLAQILPSTESLRARAHAHAHTAYPRFPT